MDEFDVTIVEANLSCSKETGQPVVALVFLPHTLCFVDGRVVGKLFYYVSNVHPLVGVKRARLRIMLGLVGYDEPFTDKELGSTIGRLLRVGVETVEFQGMSRLRVVAFLCYSGVVKTRNYSDSEYVFMMRELLEE